MKRDSLRRRKINAAERKQHFLTMLFSSTCMFFLLLFGAQALTEGNVTLAIVCATGALVNLGNLYFLKTTGRYHEACLVIVALMVALTLYLICSGGSHNTGPLWFYVMPVLIFYVLELRYGLVLLGLLITCITLILLIPDNPILLASYSINFKTRFLGSIVAVSILAFAYEYTRQDWQQEVTELARQLEELSRTDELTRLINRRDMKERLNEEVSRFKQNRRPFSIIIGDIDHFKDVNDRFGHECGDQVLQEIAATLHVTTKEQDRVSRWGGEEFLILLPETGGNDSRSVAERLRQRIESQTITYADQQVRTTMSFGVAEYDGKADLSSCIREADRNLYTSKRNGRNRVT